MVRYAFADDGALTISVDAVSVRDFAKWISDEWTGARNDIEETMYALVEELYKR